MMTDFHYTEEDYSFFRTITERPDQGGFHMHAHNHAELYCFLGGDADYRIEGTLYSLMPGDILLMRPAETHMLVLRSNAPYDRMVFHLNHAFFAHHDPDGLFAKMLNDRPLGAHNRYRLSDPSFFRFLSELPEMSRPLQRQVLLSRLLILCADASAVFAAKESTKKETSPDLAVSVVRYLNDNLCEDLSLEAVASHFYISRAQLCRIFREAIGSSMGAYVRLKRLTAAKELIDAGESAARAAAACGFRDYSSFYRAYRARYGHGPGHTGREFSKQPQP